MENLNKLLDDIETAIEKTHDNPKDKICHELHKLYTYHALDICVGKLTNNSTQPGKDGISRIKSYFERIKDLEFEKEEY